jgi:hypothetical protein
MNNFSGTALWPYERESNHTIIRLVPWRLAGGLLVAMLVLNALFD